MAVIGYSDCPACWQSAEIDDGVIQEKITYREKKQRTVAKKMIRKVITMRTSYRVAFPQKSSDPDLICQNCGYYERVWGWTHKVKEKDMWIIYIPRKTFFLPRDEFVDTVVAHEPTHVLVWEKDYHGEKWYFRYLYNWKKAFRKNVRFIKSKNTLPIKFKKRYKIYSPK